jgi:hypothetical protein
VTSELAKPDDVRDLGIFEQEIGFIPSIRLLQPSSPAVSAENPPGRAGEFLLAGETNLTASFRAFPVAWQWHAMKLEQSSIVSQSYVCETGEILTPLDQKPIWDIIPGESEESKILHEIRWGIDDSSKGLAHLWGKEFLVFCNDLGAWGILFLSKKSSRKHVKEFQHDKCLKLPCMIYSKKSPAGAPYTWFEPRCRPLSGDAEEMEGVCPPQNVSGIIEKFTARPQSEETETEDTR